jgi:hypothetical protein
MECLEEECAWWDDVVGNCCLTRLSIALQIIHEELHDINKTLKGSISIAR